MQLYSSPCMLIMLFFSYNVNVMRRKVCGLVWRVFEFVY